MSGQTPERHHVYLEIAIQEKPIGRIAIQLYNEKAPKTAENFRKLCKGDMGKGMTYKDCIFHRIIPGFMCQGGDFENGNGTGGRSIYGTKFDDENLTLQHDRPGLLSMANAGPNTNGSQFFITLDKTPWLDGKHVVFGEVTEGIEVLKEMEAVGTQNGSPTKNVKILACGEITE